jgi:hypothetical protein
METVYYAEKMEKIKIPRKLNQINIKSTWDNLQTNKSVSYKLIDYSDFVV